MDATRGLSLRSTLEHAVRARIESAAVRHGAVARIGVVHVGVWPLLRLEEFDLDFGHGLQLHADMVCCVLSVWPRFTAKIVSPGKLPESQGLIDAFQLMGCAGLALVVIRGALSFLL